MPEIDITTGAGIGTTVAAVGWVAIQRVGKPLLRTFRSYDQWPNAAKTAVWSAVLGIAAGAWAGVAFGTVEEVLIAIAIALTAGPGIQATAKRGEER